MKKKIISILCILLLAASLSGCTTVKTQVAYTVYPIEYIFTRLAGDTVQAVSIQDNSIVQRAQIVDNYKEILTESQAFFHIGQLEPYDSLYEADINSIVEDSVDLSVLNAIYDFQRYIPLVADGTVTYVEGPYYKGDAFSTIDVDDKDLYLWTDPVAMLSMAKNVRDWLIETYPDNKQLYEDNLTNLETDLIRLDAEYQSLATSVQNNGQEIKCVTMTASFGNWQKTYGIQVYPVILSKYGSLPTEEQLTIIKERIKNDNVKYIVYEPNMTDDMTTLFDTLQEELGLTRVELSNMSSLTESQINEGKDYVSLMYENLSVLRTMATAIATVENHDDIENTASTDNAIENEDSNEDDTSEESTEQTTQG